MSTNCGKKVTMVHDNITLAYFLTHFTEGYRSSSYYGYFCLKGFHSLAKKSWMFELRTFHEKHILLCASVYRQLQVLKFRDFYQVRNPMFIVDKRLEAFNDKCLKRALNSITHTVTWDELIKSSLTTMQFIFWTPHFIFINLLGVLSLDLFLWNHYY